MASLKFACVAAVMCMVVVTAPVAHAITCGQVISGLAPCIKYIRSGGAPPPRCCNRLKGLNSAAKTTADRRTACNCLKTSAASISGLNDKYAAALPGRCRVRIPYKISASTNCSSIR